MATTIYTATIYHDVTHEHDLRDPAWVESTTLKARTHDELNRQIVEWVVWWLRDEYEEDDAAVAADPVKAADVFFQGSNGWQLEKGTREIADTPDALIEAIREALTDLTVGGTLSRETKVMALQRCLVEVMK